jgi:ATP-dependent RNA helicase DeaD
MTSLQGLGLSQSEMATRIAAGMGRQEEQKTDHGMIYGMKMALGKNYTKDLQSKKVKWETMVYPADASTNAGQPIQLPSVLIDNLVESELRYTKPSIIQSVAIPLILGKRDESFIFQATNGSGKTGAFAIPAIATIDPNLKEYQVLILANTRELIRQITQVIEVLVKGTGVTVTFGDKQSMPVKSHIMVTSPGFVKKLLSVRGSTLDLKHVHMVVFDEADEIFNNTTVQGDLNSILIEEF